MRVFKATFKDHKTGQAKRTTNWYVELTDHLERVQRVPGFTSKAATAELGRKLEALIDCRGAGLTPDRTLARWLEDMPPRLRTRLVKIGLLDTERAAAGKPLAEHVEDFRADLKAERTARHADLVAGRAGRLLDGCGFKQWSDLSPERVTAYLADLRNGKKELSVQTSNFYLQAAKQFCRWMVTTRRASESPLVGLKALNVRTDRRHDRRVLTADELRRVIAAAEIGLAFRGMSGADRAMLYRVAVETGLRASELRSLTRASFRLRGDPPTVTVQAAYSKRRRTDALPLRPAMAAMLTDFLATKHPGAMAFNMPPSTCTAKMIRRDLSAARAAWLKEAEHDPEEHRRREATWYLKYTDDAGRVADFHSLRHTFITNLARGGVHPKTAQTLARHSTITLTMDRYSHTILTDQSDALACLPNLPAVAAQRAAATGTDGPRARNPLAALLAGKPRDGAKSNEAPRSENLTDTSKNRRRGGRVVEGGGLENR